MKKSKCEILSANVPENIKILGVFEGECADANITNLNGLDITFEVWENVFNSDEYKKAIKHGWYIGFLGHPEDPNCMDFEHACIVMTEGHIDSNGKVYGKFNLIDTPVGRIVKSFIDAGVKFGISVRGAGDIIDNSVDPDTFVFRGFDLVTFPAFPESIPEFSEIAASTDIAKQAKYRAVCNTVRRNLDKITSAESLDIIQSQFGAQSDEYQAIEARKSALANTSTSDDVNTDVAEMKIASMTQLYLEQVQSAMSLARDVESLRRNQSRVIHQCNNKIKALERITSCQTADLQKQNQLLSHRCRSLSTKYNEQIKANQQLNSKIDALENLNLKYKQKIGASSELARKKDSTISHLRSKLDETVNAASESKSRTSNLDAKCMKLQAKLEAAENLIAEYQDAYASLYANAVGLHLDNVTVTSSTSVAEMQNLISGTSIANMSNVFVEPTPICVEDADDADDSIVTI